MNLIQQINIGSIDEAENIINEAGTEPLFKAAQFCTRYIYKFLKNGHVRYIYKNASKIKGKKKELSNGREITIDRKNKFMLRYTDKMMSEFKSKISKLNGVEITKDWRTANTTGSYYIHYKMNGVKYEVRSSDHSPSTERNEIIPCVQYDPMKHHWLIEASLGKFQPDDVVKITKNIDKAIKKYDTDEFVDKLTTFAIKNKIIPKDDDDCRNMSHVIAEKYINDIHLKDDRYGTLFQVICFKSTEALKYVLSEITPEI